MLKDPFVSIIIPLHWGVNPKKDLQFVKDLQKYKNLRYKNYEIIIVSDRIVKFSSLGHIRDVIITHAKHFTSPAEKRDLALKYAKGTLCAFIDDDAYPHPDWLKAAVVHFQNPEIVAVGGPGLTPPEDTYWQKIGGYILESYFGSGAIQSRFHPKGIFFVKDQPAYNLLVKTSVLKNVSGWESTFYGGEDTFLCIKLIKKGKILYSEKAKVFHHRRAFPFSHIKQIANVGLHRGYFFKAYPETSRELIYTLPTVLTVGFFIGIAISIARQDMFMIAFLSLFFFAYTLGIMSSWVRGVNIFSSFIVSFGIVITHLTYGIFFIRGLLTPKLLH